MRKVFTFCLIFLSVSGITDLHAQFNKSYFFWVGRNYLMDDKYEAAIETLNVLIKVDCDLYEAYFLRGVAKYHLGDLLGAEQDFTTAIEKNPVYTMAYNSRAISRAQLGNYDDALNDFQEAIDLRPDIAGPYYSRGITYLLTQQYEKAIENFDQFLRQESKVVDGYLARGQAYLNLKDTTRAYEEFNLAIRTNRYDPAGYFRRGLISSMRRDFESALDDFGQAIECDSSFVSAYFARAAVFHDMDRPTDALRDLDAVVGLDSTNMMAYFNRGIIRASIGDYNRAMDDYNTVATYSPKNVLVFFNRAGLQTQLGDFAAAIDDYSRAIELYPDFANAYLYRSQLRGLMRDERGARNDRVIADAKIAEYRSKISDSTYSIYADTSYNFSGLMAFDSQFSRTDISQVRKENDDMAMKPMFRFLLAGPDSIKTVGPKAYISKELTEFLADASNPLLRFTTRESDIPADSIIALNRKLERDLTANGPDWMILFELGVTQSLIKQYTNAIKYYSTAIERNPSNAFLYINRSTTRSEMIDFISSIENSYQRLTIDNDPANQLKTATRTYSYDEAISDLNKAAKVLPDFAYTYYNRGNLQVFSGRMPEAYDDYSRAIELYPNFAEAYFNRALVQLYMKDTRKGLLDLSKAGELGISEAYVLLKSFPAIEQ